MVTTNEEGMDDVLVLVMMGVKEMVQESRQMVLDRSNL
jgi:hypothetical protein